jgi:ABC-type multidrug transport system ATPase subunit
LIRQEQRREKFESKMYCVETNNLTHQFSAGETALQNVNLQVVEGSIYGFLGPNGAGKTTTLKLVLGLLKRQHGEIRVFGERFIAVRKGASRKFWSWSVWRKPAAKKPRSFRSE